MVYIGNGQCYTNACSFEELCWYYSFFLNFNIDVDL